MSDQAALQEAIQRARQLAALRKNPGQHDSSGPIKVTLAYEKPINPIANAVDQSRRSGGIDDRDRERNDRDNRSDRGGIRERDRDRGRDRDRDRDRNMRSRSRSRDREPAQTLLPPSSQITQSQLLLHNNNNVPPSRLTEDKIEIIIPHAVIGLVIGKGGENIKRIQTESGATVRVDPNTIDEKGNKLCTITGTKEAVENAHAQVSDVIENSSSSKRPRLQNDTNPSNSYRMKIPASRTGAIIGKGGETIKSIKQQSGCDIELDKSAKECGPDESLFIIRGSQDKILKARAIIEARLASRGRDGGGSVGVGGGGGGRDHHSDNHSRDRGGSKNVITGANAAPVAQFTDLPSTFPQPVAQQNPADVSAAWAAYYAQFSSYVNPAAGIQPAAAGPTGGIPYAGQTSLLGSAAATVPTSVPGNHQQVPQLEPQPTQPMADLASQISGGGGQAQQDYSDQWIEYYLANGRPDYAEQIIQLKKQQQAQK